MNNMIFYKCDPNKYKDCEKTNCNECEFTLHKEYSIDGKEYMQDEFGNMVRIERGNNEFDNINSRGTTQG